MSSRHLLLANMSSAGVTNNALVKIISFGFTALVEIWYARFLINNLGVEVYGLIPLSTNIIMFGAIFHLTIISSLGRFISIEVHRGDEVCASEYYSTGFLAVTAVSFLLLIVSFFTSWFAPTLFHIPVGYENSARFLFISVQFTFVITFWVSVISVGTFVYNRIDIDDWLNIAKVACSRGLAVVLIVAFGLSITGVSLGLLAAAVITIWGAMYIHSKLTPDLKFSIRNFRRDFLNKMMAFSGWLLLRQLSVRSLLFADLFVVNHLYGATKAGLYAVAFFFPAKLRLTMGPFIGLLKPVILNRYAKNDFTGISVIASRGIRLFGVVFAFPVGTLCGLYQPIFSVWVGPEYKTLYWIAVIMTCHISINVSTYPLIAIHDAFNKVKNPAIFSCIIAGVYFILAFSLGSPQLGLGMSGVALAGALCLTMTHGIYNPIYSAFLLKTSSWTFFRAFIPGVLGGLSTILLYLLIQKWYIPSNLLQLIFLCTAVGGVYSCVAWHCLLSDPERDFILKAFQRVVKKF